LYGNIANVANVEQTRKV